MTEASAFDGKVEIVPRHLIEFGERRRENYGEREDSLENLAQSIKNIGLIQPLAVAELHDSCDHCPEGDACLSRDNPANDCYNGKPYLLLAGGRRWKATEMIGLDMLPVRIFPSQLDYLKYREIELEENIRRKDLDYKEEVALRKELHQLRQWQHGAAEPGCRTDLGKEHEKKWGIADTANELGVSVGSVSMDLKLADELEKNPDLFKGAKTKSDAMKIVKKKDDDEVRKEVLKRLESEKAEAGPEAHKQQLIDAYILRDFFEGVAAVQDGVINLVEIDPPYGIDLKKTKQNQGPVEATNLDAYNEVPSNEYTEFMTKVFKESYRVMKDNSWIICWFAHEPWFETMYQLMRDAGFEGNRMVGAWLKKTGQTQQPQRYLANVTEFFFYMRKGNPTIARPGRSNAFHYPAVPPSKKNHPTERPLDLMKDVLSTFAQPGQRVMVPFLGSGKTILAADEVGLNAFGYDLAKEYKDKYIISVHKGVEA